MKPLIWIDGKWKEAHSKKCMTVENPANLEVIAEAADADAQDVDLAVKAARKSFEDGRWAGLTPSERSRVLWKLADLIEARSFDFARMEALNTGKPYKNLCLAGDLPFTVDNLRFFATAARDTSGMRAGEFAAGYTSYARREPVGVVAQIAPWNYPLMMAAWKIGPALAAGCSIVFKPAPGTPLTALALSELSQKAGIPDGVLNIVTGGNETGEALVDHPDVNLVSLTGSTATGKRIMATASATLKKVHLELGGKAPLLVFPDADIELAATKAALGATTNTGQDCTAATRVIAHSSVVRAFTEALVVAMERVTVGDPFDDSVTMGPCISAVQRKRVAAMVQRAMDGGARLLTGGRSPTALSGHFYAPTVLDNVDQRSEIVQSEVFGPVLTVQSFETEEEAIGMANDVPFGLAASVFTRDIGRALRTTRRLRFGTVWVNDHLPLTAEAPHGGFKQSGFGKDMGLESVGDYLITKHVMMSGLE